MCDAPVLVALRAAFARRERAQTLDVPRRVARRHARSRERRLGAGADVARGPGAQIVHVLRWRTGDLGGFGHHAEVARRGYAALPRVDDVHPGQHRLGAGVRRQAVYPAADLLVETEFRTLPAVQVLLVLLG